MTNGTIWARVGSWFKQASRLNGDSGDWPRLDGDGGRKSLETSAGRRDATAQRAEDARAAEQVSSGLHLSDLTGKRRDAALQRLQAGYEQVAGLIESLQNYMHAQDTRTAEISQSLAQLAASLTQVPELSKRQADTLATIASQLQMAGERTRRIEEVLPKLAHAHHEVLSSLGSKLDATRAIDERMVGALDIFRDAVATLGHTSEANTTTLKTMEASAASRDEHLVGLMGQQNRRFVMLFAVTALLAAGAIATCVVALVR